MEQLARRLAILATVYTAGCVTIALALPARAPAGCHATQPVYSASYTLVGTWDVTVPVGQSVTLPDGDTATCTAHGVTIH